MLKDKTFFHTLPTLLKDESSDVIRYTVKILVLLTEQSGNIEQLLKSADLLPALSEACENITNPSVNYNLVLVSSRIRVVKNSLDAKRAEKEPLADAIKELDKGGTLHRKFVGRKSKQIIMEFDAEEFDETKKLSVERGLLKKKGVISVYITEQNSIPRAVLRTIPTIEAKDIAQSVFAAAGFEYVAQLVKVNGIDEKFEFYASEMGKITENSKDYPEYLDDDVLHVDPASCVITNEMAAHGSGQEGGWFSSITSFVKTSLW